MEIKPLASGSKGNAYIISDGVTALLLDAGIPLKEIMIGCDFRLSSLSGCLITHSHMDHCKADKDLIKRAVPIFTSMGTIKARNLGFGATVVEDRKPVVIGTFKVLPFNVEHDAPEPLGFMIESLATKEKLLYFTDTYYLKYKFSGLTQIMGECNYSKAAMDRAVDEGRLHVDLAKRLYKSHMSLETFLEFLKANDISKVKQIYLLHMSDTNGEEERFKREVQELTGTEVYVC